MLFLGRVFLLGSTLDDIVALAEAVRTGIGGEFRVDLRRSPKGSSQSTGAAERAIQSVEGQLRTMKEAFDMLASAVGNHQPENWG